MEQQNQITHFTTELLLIRHGQTDWNVQERIQGQIDIPLNQEGLRQADLVAQELAKLDIAGIYSSDLTRALSTAQALSTLIQKPIVALEALREMHAGEAQGLTSAEREILYGTWRLWLEQLPLEQRTGHPEWPLGESQKDVFARAYKCLTDLAHNHPYARIAVITHSGIIHTLIRILGYEEVALPNCSVASFSYHSAYQETPLKFNGVTYLEKPLTVKQMSTQVQL